VLVLDSGGVSLLAEQTPRALATIVALRSAHEWPPTIPTVVLVECLRGAPSDANTNRLIKTCAVQPSVPVRLARRAAELRRRAGRGSAVDALVVATAEPGGTVLTTDALDLLALAEHADNVAVEAI
jgi:hypothetical protein